jgi:hypothetical protein
MTTAIPSPVDVHALHAQVQQLRHALAEVTSRLADLTETPAPVAVTYRPVTIAVTTIRYDWRALRHSRGWSQSQVMTRIEQAAAERGIRLAGRSALKQNLNRWEHNKARVSAFYLPLLCSVFDLPTGPQLQAVV